MNKDMDTKKGKKKPQGESEEPENQASKRGKRGKKKDDREEEDEVTREESPKPSEPAGKASGGGKKGKNGKKNDDDDDCEDDTKAMDKLNIGANTGEEGNKAMASGGRKKGQKGKNRDDEDREEEGDVTKETEEASGKTANKDTEQASGVGNLPYEMAEGAKKITVGDIAKLRNDGYVKRKTIENQPPVRAIFVGEGNFTYSTAFASSRGSWDNIIASEKDGVPDYYQTLVLTVRSCLTYGNELIGQYSPEDAVVINKETIQLIDKIVNLGDTNFRPYVDATLLQEACYANLFDTDLTCAIFFQCPYDGYKNGETKCLVRSFLSSASEVQHPGDFLFIGITTYFLYCNNYGLPELIGNVGQAQQNGYAWQNGYRFIGADAEFPKDMLRRGYKHQGVREIHDDIKDNHLTLCFLKLDE